MWVLHDVSSVTVEEVQCVFGRTRWRICEGMPRGQYVCSSRCVAKVFDVL